MQDIETIGLIGAGSIGSALGAIFQENGKKVLLWDQDPDKRTANSEIELIEASQLIVICTPSWEVPQIAKKIAENTTKPQLVLSVSKGVGSNFKLVPQMLEEASKDKYDWGVLYGPMLAKEIKEGKYSSAVMAVNNTSWNGCLDFSAERLHVLYGDDPKTTAICGVLKNIYAVGLGISDGLDLGYNAKGQLTTAIFAEMKLLVGYLGGDPTKVEGAAGLGDLLATGWSGMSFNYNVGKALAKHHHKRADSEGTHSLRELIKVIPEAEFKIIESIHLIITDKAQPETIKDLINQ